MGLHQCKLGSWLLSGCHSCFRPLFTSLCRVCTAHSLRVSRPRFCLCFCFSLVALVSQDREKVNGGINAVGSEGKSTRFHLQGRQFSSQAPVTGGPLLHSCPAHPNRLPPPRPPPPHRRKQGMTGGGRGAGLLQGFLTYSCFS